MFLYVNGFKCAAGNAKKEVAIQFTQDGPLFQEDGTCGTIRDEVTSIVMSRETAVRLAVALQKLDENVEEVEDK